MGMFLISIISGFNFFLLSLVLFLKKSPYKEQNRYLAFIFLFSSIYEGMNAYFNYFIIHDISFLKYYIAIDIIAMMFSAPMVLFYALSITTGRVKFNLKSIIYLIPILPNLIFETYLALLPGSERIDYLVENYYHMNLEVVILDIWFYFNLIFYLSLSLRKISLFRKKLPTDKISVFDKNTKWFRTYIIIILTLLIASFPISILSNDEQVYIIVGQVVMNVQFIYVFIQVLKNTALFPSNSNQSLNKEKYASSLLSIAQIDNYYKNALDYIKKGKLFLDTNLTIEQLACELKITSHSLSQAINVKTDSNFSDLLNQLRVEESKRLMALSKYGSFTLEAIAFESGFGNKVSFNKAFKKFEGITPSEFRKGLKL